MATIASLSVNLGMNTASFGKGAQSAIGSLQSIEKSSALTAISTGALAAGNAMVFVAGKAWDAAKAIAGMVSSSIDAIDQLKDQAQTAAVTTDALQKLQYAATLNGSSAEAVTNALAIMNRQLGSAADAGGPVADAISDIGLNVQDLVGMSPDQAFAQIAEGFSKIANPAERARVAQAIFGKSSRDLLNVLSLGKDGLAAAGAEAARFGSAISQVDAEKVGAAKDALDRASFAVGGLKNKLAIELAPFIELAANKFAELASVVSGPVATVVVAAVEGIAMAVGKVVDIVETSYAVWLGLKATVLSVATGALDAFNSLGQGIADVLNLIPGVSVQFDRAVGDMANSLRDQMGEAVGDIGKIMGQNRSADVAAWFDDIRAKAQDSATIEADTKAKAAAAGRAPAAGGDKSGSSSRTLQAVASASQRAVQDVVSKFRGGGDGKVAAFERRFTQGFTRDQGGDPQKEILKAIQKQAKANERTAKATERIAAQEPIEVADF